MENATTETTPQTPVEGQVTDTQATSSEATQAQEEGQVKQTAETQQEQPQGGADSVDLSKIPADQLTGEQVAELQKGYLRQSDYTTKTQELSKEKEGLSDYDALIQRPDFIQWAASKQAQTQPPQTVEAEEETVANMTEAERINFYVQKSLKPIAQSYYQDKQTSEDEKNAVKYGDDIYSPHKAKITQMQYEIAKNPNLYREEAFKILDYEAYGKRCIETGRQEGLTGKETRQQANMVQGEGSPSTQREQFTGTGALQKIFERNEKEGRTSQPL